MSNHFHWLIQMLPEHNYKDEKDEEIRKRCKAYYGEEFEVSDEQIVEYGVKLSSLANYMKEIKQAFFRYYNQRHNRRGTLWGERFKSVIVENGETLINFLAYIDLNPLRAGLVKRPEEYRWNSLGYHVQTNNQDNFLSTDFGPGEIRSAVTSELHWAGVLDPKERLNGYRRYVYEAGALNRSDKRQVQVIESDILEKERESDFELKRVRRFRYRIRYFTDSGIIGTKEFVSENYQRFKIYFLQSTKKSPNRLKA